MAVTTTAQLNSIVDQVILDHPHVTFQKAAVARWSSPENTVYFQTVNSLSDMYLFFHELGHGLRRHRDYDQDIELLRIENDAWQQAVQTASTYGFTIENNTIDEALDSYREWLHARSRCPTCTQSGVQQKSSGMYICLLCNTSWRTNDARRCGLKRYTKK